MKAFLEEYGLVIVVIIVVAVLISLAVYFSNHGQKEIQNTYDSFTKGANAIVQQSISNAEKNALEGGFTDGTPGSKE